MVTTICTAIPKISPISSLPTIVETLSALPCRSPIIDGEAVVLDEDGVTDFFAFHAAASPFRLHPGTRSPTVLSMAEVDEIER
jgi:hypothetical protein